MSRSVDWETLLAEIAQFIEAEKMDDGAAVTAQATAPFITRLVHTWLDENRQYLIDTAVGLDRTYLNPFIGKVLGDDNIVELLTAIAEADIDEGLRQTG